MITRVVGTGWWKLTKGWPGLLALLVWFAGACLLANAQTSDFSKELFPPAPPLFSTEKTPRPRPITPPASSRTPSSATTTNGATTTSSLNTLGMAALPPAPASWGGDLPAQLRRIDVPGESHSPADFTQRGYVAVDREQFDKAWKQWLSRASAQPRGSRRQLDDHPPEARQGVILESLACDWDLREEELVGTIEGQVRLLQDTPCLLTLTPWPWITSAGSWRDSPGELIAGMNARGEYQIWVPASGTFRLSVKWPAQVVDKDLVFAGRLPAALSRTLSLSMPAMTQAQTTALVPVKREELPENRVRETWQLAGEEDFQLRIGRQAQVEGDQPQAFAIRPTIIYEAGPQGLQLLWEGKLVGPNLPNNRLLVKCDADLKILEVKSGTQKLGFELLAADAAGGSTYALDMPRQELGKMLQILAAAPLHTGDLWQLPQLHLEEVLLQEENWQLLTLAPFALDQLELRDCRQTLAETLRGKLPGEAIHLQTIGKEPQILALYRWQQARGAWSSGLELTSADNDAIRATWTAEVELEQGELARLEIEVADFWNVESLESSPADSTGSWTRTHQDHGVDLYSLQFAQPLRERRLLRFVLRATAPRASGAAQISAAQLDLARVVGLPRQAGYLSLNLGGTWQPRFLPAPPKKLDPRQLTTAELALFGEETPEQLYAWPGAAEGFALRLERTTPATLAELETRIRVGQSEIHEEFHVRFPAGTPHPRRLTLLLTELHETPITWRLHGSRAPLNACRRLSIPEQLQLDWPMTGEAWELTLPTSRGETWGLIGERRLPLAGEARPTLLALPAAFAQRGVLTVSSPRNPAPVVRAEQAVILPLEAASAGEEPLLGRWEYLSPTRSLHLRDSPIRIVCEGELSRQAEPRQPVIWLAELETFCSEQPAWLQRMTLSVEQFGPSEIPVQMPAGRTLQAALWNGQPLAWSGDPQEPRLVKLSLPASDRYGSLQLRWTTPRARHWLGLKAQPEWPELRITPLARRWKIWSPPELTPLWGRDWPSRDGRGADTRWSQIFSHWRQQPGTPLWGLGNIFSEFAPEQTALSIQPEVFWQKLSQQLSRQRNAQAGGVTPDTLATPVPNRQPPSASPGPRSTWGQLLPAAWRDAALSQDDLPELWIDQDAFSTLGVFPDLPPLPPLKAASSLTKAPNQATTSPFVQSPGELPAKFILIQFPTGWLLTTRGQLVQWPTAVPLARGERCYGFPVGQELSALAEFQRIQSLAWPTIVPLTNWQAAPTTTTDSWQAGPASTTFPADATHGAVSAWLPRIVPETSSGILLVHQPLVLAIAWAGFFLLLGTSVWWLPWRAPFKVLLLTAGLVSLWLLPWGLISWGQAWLASIIVAQLLRWLQFWPWWGWTAQPNNSAARAVPGMVAASWAIALGLGCEVWVLFAAPAMAQPEPVNITTEVVLDAPAISLRPSAILVYARVNAQQQAVDNVLWVPAELWKQLHSPPQPPSTARTDYLLQSAEYEGSLRRMQSSDRPRPGRWQADWRIHTFLAEQWVGLPFPARGAVLIPDAILLDDQPASWRWSADGGELQFFVRAPGGHRLRVGFLPRMRESGMQPGLELSLPRAPRNSLRITAPEDLRWSSNLKDEKTFAAQQSTAPLEFSARETLRVDWPNQEAANALVVQAELELLQWLRVRPGAAQLEVRIPIRVVAGQLRGIELVVDERLQLLTQVGSADLPWRAMRRGRTLQLEFPQPIQDRATVQLSFLIRDFAGLGILTPPQCEVIGQTIKSAWLFGSVDSSLNHRELSQTPQVEIPPREIQRLWPEESTAPQFVYNWQKPPSDWRLEISPRDPQISLARESTHIALARPLANWSSTLSLTIADGAVWRLAGTLPTNFELEHVVVRQDRQTVPCRWARGAPGHFSLFFESPVGGELIVALHGRQSLAETRGTYWSWIGVQEQTAQVRELLVEHAANLHAQVQIPAGFTKLTAAETTAARQAAQQATDESWPSALSALIPLPGLRAINAGSPVRLEWRANSPTGQIQVITQLDRRGDGWWVVWDLLGQLPQGELAQLECQLPAICRELGELSPNTPIELSPAVPGGERYLTLRPATAWQGTWRQRLTCRLSKSPEQLLQVPRLQIFGGLSTPELLVLPRRCLGKPVDWQLPNLTPAKLPSDYLPALSDTSQPLVFQLNRDGGAVSLRATEQSADQPRVSLADHAVFWDGNTGYSGKVIFYLEPAGQGTCILELPPGAELRQGITDGTWLPWKRLGDRRWEVRLASALVPQQLSVVYTLPALNIDEHNLLRFAAPYIQDWPVQRALWTVGLPGTAGRLRLTTGEMRTPEQLQIERLAATIAICEKHLPALRELAPAEKRLWSDPWRERLRQARGMLEMAVRGRQDDPRYEVTTEELARLAERMSRLQTAVPELTSEPAALPGMAPLSPANAVGWPLWSAVDLQISQAVVAASPDSPATSALARLMARPISTARQPEADGNYPPTMTARLEPPTVSNLAASFGGLAAMLLATTALSLTLARWPEWNLASRHPWLVFLLAGCAWWLWLRPREIAVGLLVLGVLAYLAENQRLRRWWQSLPLFPPRPGWRMTGRGEK
ncbi:MAG: hypothetical protein SFX18_04810 [Pirellulales bacterium]|nr:hypothetical protein [Pirellulales bacterium]